MEKLRQTGSVEAGRAKREKSARHESRPDAETPTWVLHKEIHGPAAMNNIKTIVQRLV